MRCIVNRRFKREGWAVMFAVLACHLKKETSYERAHAVSLTTHAITLSDVPGMYRMSGLSRKVVWPTTLKNPSALIHLPDPSIIIRIIYVGSILKIRNREVSMLQMNSCQGLFSVWLHEEQNDLVVQFSRCSQTHLLVFIFPDSQ